VKTIPVKGWTVSLAGFPHIEWLHPVSTVSSYTDASIDSPQNITTGPDGALWFIDRDGYIRRIFVTNAELLLPA